MVRFDGLMSFYYTSDWSLSLRCFNNLDFWVIRVEFSLLYRASLLGYLIFSGNGETT